MNYMDVRTINHANKNGSKKITLPEGWGEVGKKVFIRTISDKELKIYLVDDLI